MDKDGSPPTLHSYRLCGALDGLLRAYNLGTREGARNGTTDENHTGAQQVRWDPNQKDKNVGHWLLHPRTTANFDGQG